MASQPEWAGPIIEAVCRDARRRVPKVHWSVRAGNIGSTGTTYWRGSTGPTGENIRLRCPATIYRGEPEVPADLTDERALDRYASDVVAYRYAKAVLLHELAHWLAPKGHSHSVAFWRICWRLYAEHLTFREQVQAAGAERDYMKRSLGAAPPEVLRALAERDARHAEKEGAA